MFCRRVLLMRFLIVSGGITSLFIITPSLKSPCTGENPSPLLLFTSAKVKLIFLNFCKEVELNRGFLTSQSTVCAPPPSLGSVEKKIWQPVF